MCTTSPSRAKHGSIEGCQYLVLQSRHVLQWHLARLQCRLRCLAPSLECSLELFYSLRATAEDTKQVQDELHCTIDTRYGQLVGFKPHSGNGA